MQPEHLLVYLASYIALFTGIFYLLTFLEKKDYPEKLAIYPNVSLIIPAYNEEKTITETIASIISLNYPKDKLEIIVVNDGSTDDTKKIVTELIKQNKNLKLITQKNKGKSAALNRGIKQANGEFIGTLDADCALEKNALQEMLPYFNDKKVIAVTPAMKSKPPQTILQRVQQGEYVIGIFIRKVLSNLNSLYLFGPFPIYRKTFFKEHGLLDEHNPTEDLEIAFRILDKNYKIKNCSTTSVYTTTPDTFNKLLNQRMRWYYGMYKNLLGYKQLLRPSSKELSTFALPTTIAFIILPLALFAHFLIKYFGTVVTWFRHISSIDFDIIPIITSMTAKEIKISLYSALSTPLFIFFIITIPIIIVYYLIGKKLTKETTGMKFSLLCTLSLYWALFSFWWLTTLIYKLFGGKIRWGKQKY